MIPGQIRPGIQVGVYTMKVIQIAGYLGSGKTTSMIEFGRTLSKKQNKKVALIVNEIGEVPVDGKVMKEFDLEVKDIGGGCICCTAAINLIKTLEILHDHYSPDYVLVEPTGVAIPNMVKKALDQSAKMIDGLEKGKAVVLLDATRPRKLLGNKHYKHLVEQQLKDADVVAINKIDCAKEDDIEYAIAELETINSEAEIIKISSKTGVGMDELLATIS